MGVSTVLWPGSCSSSAVRSSSSTAVASPGDCAQWVITSDTVGQQGRDFSPGWEPFAVVPYEGYYLVFSRGCAQ